MCFVLIWEQTAIISLYSINWLGFISETECVYCAVRTGSLYTASLAFNNSTFCPHSVFMCFVWIWEQTAIISRNKTNCWLCNAHAVCFLAAWHQTSRKKGKEVCANWMTTLTHQPPPPPPPPPHHIKLGQWSNHTPSHAIPSNYGTNHQFPWQLVGKLRLTMQSISHTFHLQSVITIRLTCEQRRS